MTSDPTPPSDATLVGVLRTSHDRLASVLGDLDAAAVEQPSYDSEWSIADVASHLGSGAEIFALALAAGLSGTAAPAGEQFQAIWADWNAKAPAAQVADCLTADQALVEQMEQLSDEQRAGFALAFFGTDLDFAALAGMRIGEHAAHTWDVAVALDPQAVIAPDAVPLMLEGLPRVVARAGRPAESPGTVRLATTSPDRTFVLTTHPEVGLTDDDPDDARQPSLQLPAEALVRLVYGRLDPDHLPAGVEEQPLLTELRTVFPGF